MRSRLNIKADRDNETVGLWLLREKKRIDLMDSRTPVSVVGELASGGRSARATMSVAQGHTAALGFASGTELKDSDWGGGR